MRIRIICAKKNEENDEAFGKPIETSFTVSRFHGKI
jgi:hypothetical protein